MLTFKGGIIIFIEIEYYKGDTLLYGVKVTFEEFKKQIDNIERLYDKREDNFIPLLCRMYYWTVHEGSFEPQYIYDRDIKKYISPKYIREKIGDE